jgi:hypothetical protein
MYYSRLSLIKKDAIACLEEAAKIDNTDTVKVPLEEFKKEKAAVYFDNIF